jgi:DNA-binding HxlR family transcriptional regulator
MKPVDLELHHDCRPVGEILNQIGGKWTVLIINMLSNGPMRFSEIRRMVGGISQKVLTATLRDLEMDGFVTRTVSIMN